MIGRSLAHFRVEEKLGAGGMGEVYRALDTRLGRPVALKVLPAALARDPERLARLEREARLLASLNHPGIAAVHGLEDFEGVRFLVMELVPGETLADRLAAGPLPLAEALAVGRQIAAALEAAHEAGVVHRDLKPANVMLRPDGSVKVLDFGLAKGLGPTASGAMSQSPTITSEGTHAGVILGTAAYMSPEQARGRPLDRRTDLWSFGCVLFEALSGQRPFGGETTSDVISSILTREPDWAALPAATPAAIRGLLRRCLSKDPQRRLRDAGDAGLEIEEAGTAGSAAAPALGGGDRRAGRLAAVCVVGLAAIVAAFVAGRWVGGGSGLEAPDWQGDRLVGSSTFGIGPRISPDGETLAYQTLVDGITQVAIMKPGTEESAVVTRETSQGPVLAIEWSRDGSRVYFDRAGHGIYSVPALGGEERLVVSGLGIVGALPDGDLLAYREGDTGLAQIQRFHPGTGNVEPIGPTFREIALMIQPAQVSPDGRKAIYLGGAVGESPSAASFALYLLDLDSGVARELLPGSRFGSASSPLALPAAFSPDGTKVIVAVAAGDLYPVIELSVDGSGSERTLFTLAASPWFLDVAQDGSIYLDQVDVANDVLRFPATGGVPQRIARYSNALSAAVSSVLPLPDGRVLVTGVASGGSRLLVTRPGQVPQRFVESDERTSGPMALAGNDRVAFLIGEPPEEQIALATLDGRILSRLPCPGALIADLAASPDGRTLYYVAGGELWALPIEGGAPRRIGTGDAVTVDPGSGDLIVRLGIRGEVRLFRQSPSGGESREIPLPHDGFDLARTGMGSRAIRSDGLLAVALMPSNSWFWGPGVLDLRTGKSRSIPIAFEADVYQPSWTADGALVAGASEYRTQIWRYRVGGRVGG